MSASIGGQRPRPRVALLGEFAEEDLNSFRRMFPTIWHETEFQQMRSRADIREIDLLVISREVPDAGSWPENAHVICFSKDVATLPGPTADTLIALGVPLQTEEFVFTDVPLPLSRCREADLGNLFNVRGWLTLRIIQERNSRLAGRAMSKEAAPAFQGGAIICDRHTNAPLATTYVRHKRKLGVAWLPFTPISPAAWVEALVTHWAEFDKESFPHSRDWTRLPEWMVIEEEQILSEIETLERQKQQQIAEIDANINRLVAKFAEAKDGANKTRRRLITAQGDELLQEVSEVLRELGFTIDIVDQLLSKGQPKREDLRLRYPFPQQHDWEAIAEVRGYARSGGTTRDLLRLGRFANLYSNEKGRLPDKIVYIVNGQLELLPSQRQKPLASSPEDVDEFAESGGLIVWTLELFRAVKATSPNDYGRLRESLKDCLGHWTPQIGEAFRHRLSDD